MWYKWSQIVVAFVTFFNSVRKRPSRPWSYSGKSKWSLLVARPSLLSTYILEHCPAFTYLNFEGDVKMSLPGIRIYTITTKKAYLSYNSLTEKLPIQTRGFNPQMPAPTHPPPPPHQKNCLSKQTKYLSPI